MIGEQGKVVSEEIRALSVVAGGTVQANVIADKVQFCAPAVCTAM